MQAAVQVVLDTRPQGGPAGGGLSREEAVDAICEELLSKVGAWGCRGVRPGCALCNRGRALVKSRFTGAPCWAERLRTAAPSLAGCSHHTGCRYQAQVLARRCRGCLSGRRCASGCARPRQVWLQPSDWLQKPFSGAGAQVPPLFEREEVHERLRKLPGGPAQPLTVHLRQEVDRINIILALTATTLSNLRLAIAGAKPCSTHMRMIERLSG